MHPRLVDALLALALTLVLAVVITADLENTGRAGPFAYLYAVLFGAMLLVRRQAPRWVLLVTVLFVFVYYIFELPPIGIALPAAAALFSAAEAGWTRWATVAGVVLVGVAAFARLHEGLPPEYLYSYDLLTNIALAAAAIALGVSVRSRREIRAHEERERKRAVLDQQREAERLLQTERFSIARDLHDVIGHTMSVIAVHSNVAAEAIGRSDAAAAAAVEQIRQAASATMRELRTTVKVLRAGPDEQPERSTVGIAGLARLFEQAESAGVHVEAAVGIEPGAVDSAIEAAVYRIVQESLTNVIRHSAAPTVSVTVECCARDVRTHPRTGADSHPEQLWLEVRDAGPAKARVPLRSGADARDGDGQGAGTVSGRGIEGMAERVRLLGGEFAAGPVPEGGFAVTATLPRSLPA
ncbi:sensor histidine kinase [Brevibacterium daeguense]|uniref:histidine kinase n=1 Tax=Brevibacterium daeguense TaxID=909936 RepID=A0ABP8EJ19_9MICO